MNHSKSSRNSWLYARRSEWVPEQEKRVAAYFAKRNRATIGRGYIIADSKAWELNLVDPSLKEWLLQKKEHKRKQHQHFPIHEWIHHGLSSQALLINLVGPLIRDKRWTVFDEVFDSAGLGLKGKVNDVDLEYEDASVFSEHGQSTSFDLASKTDADEKIFIEFKFTEKEFGGCSLFQKGDCDGENPAPEKDRSGCYLHHHGRKYWEKMDSHGLTATVSSERTCPFANMYQAYREMLFTLERHGKFLLIYDARNTAFVSEPQIALEAPKVRGLWTRFVGSLPKSARASTSAVTIQQIVRVLDRPDCPWIADLCEKHDFPRA